MRLRLAAGRGGGLDALLLAIVESFAAFLAEGDPSRLRVCENADCRWVFYDSTRSRTRRWCAGSCGNLIKVREFRRSEVTFELPYDPKLVGNPDTGVLHGGAITALLDACSGAAVFAALTEWKPIATLDLRIDYLRAGEPGQAIVCKASCYKLTRNVAFTRAVAYHEDETDPIATSMGTFMVGTKPGGTRKP